MRTFRRFQHENEDELPSEFDSDTRTPESFVEDFVTEFSEADDSVLDPFAGFGTTLKVAERLGRVPYGIEYEKDRAAFVRDRIEHGENVVHGNVLEFTGQDDSTFDLFLTSPPYMEATDGRSPFRNYAGESNYDEYLDNLRTAFSRVETWMGADSHVLVDISNLKYDGSVTTLLQDAGRILSEIFHFEGEIAVGWEANGEQPDGNYGYDHNYCLVFRTTE